jgi:hypothetical protein
MGWESGQRSHGTDLGPWIADPGKASDRPAYAWVGGGQREGWSIRTATHRYGLMRWGDGEPRPYLFALEADPDQARNAVEDPAMAAVVKEMDGRLRAFYAIPPRPAT